jgi:hypothetical protein
MFVVLFSGISNSLSICLVPLLSQRDTRTFAGSFAFDLTQGFFPIFECLEGNVCHLIYWNTK